MTEAEDRISEIRSRIPPHVLDQIGPFFDMYGPAFAKMASDELRDWILDVLNGRTLKAYESVVSRLDNDELAREMSELKKKWGDLAEEEAAARRLQREALLAVLRVLLVIAAAAAGV